MGTGVLVVAYIQVFTDRPKTNFADSLLPFLENPYSGLSPTHLVGQLFVGNAETSANVSLLGHGYLSFGYVGIYIEAAVLAVFLRVIDDACEGATRGHGDPLRSAAILSRVQDLRFAYPRSALPILADGHSDATAGLQPPPPPTHTTARRHGSKSLTNEPWPGWGGLTTDSLLYGGPPNILTHPHYVCSELISAPNTCRLELAEGRALHPRSPLIGFVRVGSIASGAATLMRPSPASDSWWGVVNASVRIMRLGSEPLPYLSGLSVLPGGP